MFNSKAKIERVKQLYLGLPESWRTQLASAWHTFVPAFGLSVLASLAAVDEFNLSLAALSALAAAILDTAARAGFKAVSVKFFSRALPDPKK